MAIWNFKTSHFEISSVHAVGCKTFEAGEGQSCWSLLVVGSWVDPPVVVVPFAEQFLTITKVKDTPVSRQAPTVVASMTLAEVVHGLCSDG